MVCGAAKPLHRFVVVLRHAAAAVIDEAEGGLGAGVALIGQRAWWPGRIERPLAGHASEAAQDVAAEPTGNGSARSRSTRL